MADTRFKKGATPWNKGTVGVMKSNSGTFQKGQVAINKIGTIKTCTTCSAKYPVKGIYRRANSKYCSMPCAMKGKPSPMKGRTASSETRLKMREAKLGIRGEAHWNWRPWTRDNHRERVYFRDTMQKKVFARDNWTCVICQSSGEVLHVDHIKRWAEYPELRFVESNCRTVCRSCHYYITFKRKMSDESKWGLTARMTRERG